MQHPIIPAQTVEVKMVVLCMQLHSSLLLMAS
jgi:hypothetical protein